MPQERPTETCGGQDEDERADVAREAAKVAAEVADKRLLDKEARRDAASMINDDDLQLLYLAHLRLSVHMSRMSGLPQEPCIRHEIALYHP